MIRKRGSKKVIKQRKQNREEWTSDLREIERRMIKSGLMSGGSIWDKSDLRKVTK